MSELNKEQLERVMRKIRNCLALSGSPNEHEAAAAMRQAQKLMQRHRLSLEDVRLSDVGQRDGKQCVKRPAWDVQLSNVVAEAFGCEAFTHKHYDEDADRRLERVTFIGVAPSADIAMYAYDTLYVKLRAARREYIRKIRTGEVQAAGAVTVGKVSKGTKSKRRKLATPETRGNHFSMAWVWSVESKLKALVPAVDDPESNERALIVTRARDSDLIAKYLHQITDGRGEQKSRARPGVVANEADLRHGMAEGRRTELNHGVGTTGDQQLALGVAS